MSPPSWTCLPYVYSQLTQENLKHKNKIFKSGCTLVSIQEMLIIPLLHLLYVQTTLDLSALFPSPPEGIRS